MTSHKSRDFQLFLENQKLPPPADVPACTCGGVAPGRARAVWRWALPCPARPVAHTLCPTRQLPCESAVCIGTPSRQTQADGPGQRACSGPSGQGGVEASPGPTPRPSCHIRAPQMTVSILAFSEHWLGGFPPEDPPGT